MSKITKPVDAIKHPKDTRLDIPTTEHAGEEAFNVADDSRTASYKTFRHEFTRGRDPELYWLGKYDNDDEDTQSPDMKVDIRSLYVHEDVQPEMLINNLYHIEEKKSEVAELQGELFSDTELSNPIEDELEKVADYYKHSSEWKNRLIQGDSLLVMNSLLKREGMAGKVQCIYIDPPYGIKYGSNWQMKLDDKNMKDNDDNLSGEPEMIKAFRDTWELGIHSYLSYLRDRITLSFQLLHESGSIFVQINDENVHLVRNLLDDVFGSENYVSQIVYTKTSSFASDTIGNVADFVLWYAKDKEKIKVRKLFTEHDVENDPYYCLVELHDGKRMSIKEWEKDNEMKFNYKCPPKGCKIFMSGDLQSQGKSNNQQPYVFEGHTYFPAKNRHWTANYPIGMDRLTKANRIFSSSGSTIRYVRYIDDFPYIERSNIWVDTSMGGFSDKKTYVVQTSTKVIQRCILMTTDPGDLVLDPTCGSGTTAYVAEQWGRRWITMDTSRIALNIAKKRLTTAVYPYYELFDKEGKDIRQGFIYKKVPHITLKALANDLPFDEETLYDQPLEDKKRIRVAGPFTVETLQSYNIKSPEDMEERTDEVEENRLFQERIFSHLMTSGIRNGRKEEQAKFSGVEALASPYLHAKGYYTDANGLERTAYFHIGPKFGTVSKQDVTMALQEFVPKARNEGASWLVILGFSFEDNINDKDYNLGTYTVSKVRMHDDLMQDGLLKKDKGAGAFITIGEPDIELVKDDDTHCHVEIRGLDIYDPIKDDVQARSLDQIAYWEIDDRYDSSKFVVRGIHFCGGDKKEFNAWKKGLQSTSSYKTKKNAERTLKLVFNDDVWDELYSYRSEPLTYEPGRKVAIRVVSQFGEESTKVLVM